MDHEYYTVGYDSRHGVVALAWCDRAIFSKKFQYVICLRNSKKKETIFRKNNYWRWQLDYISHYSAEEIMISTFSSKKKNT